jgi:hypothetical protein
MTTSSVNSPSWLNPAQQLLEFLNALPSPFREQLLYRLYGFFYDEIYQCFLCGDDPDETLSMIVTPYSDYLNFQRAILIIGALDYLFSQKSPWPRIVEAYPEIELEGMKGAYFPCVTSHTLRRVKNGRSCVRSCPISFCAGLTRRFR